MRPDRGSFARFASLRWAALPIVDRRWTAPMAGVALGFGLFVGVAIGPGTQGTKGASGPMMVQVPATPAETETQPSGGTGGTKPAPGPSPGANGGGSPAPASPPQITSPPSTPPAPATTTPPTLAPPVTTTPPPPITPTPEAQAPAEPAEPAEEPVTALSGTVVHLNPKAHSYTIADDGSLTAIHTHRPPGLGKAVEVDARRLANGTYVEDGKREENGSRNQASFEGTVSFSDDGTGAYTVSAPGVSLLVRGTGARKPPQLGANVEVRVRIADDPKPLPVRPAGEQGCGRPPALPKPPQAALEQVSLRIAEGEPASQTDVEGIVEGVCRETRKLLVSADDLRESGRDIGLYVPKALKIGKLEPGQVLKLTAEIRDGGTLALSTVAGDEGGKGADDQDLVQP